MSNIIGQNFTARIIEQASITGPKFAVEVLVDAYYPVTNWLGRVIGKRSASPERRLAGLDKDGFVCFQQTWWSDRAIAEKVLVLVSQMQFSSVCCCSIDY